MTPEQRFKDSFYSRIKFGISKKFDMTEDKDKAFDLANYLLFPKNSRRYVVVDIDHEDAAFSWEKVDLPQPTIIIGNPVNGHAHILWELKKEVFWGNNRQWQSKPRSYFRGVQKAITTKINGDKGYTCASTKNPFSSMWKTFWFDIAYDLNDLSEYITQEKDILPPLLNVNYFAGRNSELFYYARIFSYRNAWRHDDYLNFYNILFDYCTSYNRESIPIMWPDKGPLDESEVETICTNVINWVWPRKDDPAMKQRVKNIGTMKYDPIDRKENVDDYLLEIRNRQSSGAMYVNRKKAESREQLIISAISLLRKDNLKITLSRVSELTGYTYSHIHSYKHFIEHNMNSF